MQTLNIITWNIRGFRTQSKRLKVINHLTKLKADICFLQETHLTNAESEQLKFNQFNKIFSSTYNSKQRGVSILINNNCQFTLNQSIIDPNGRFIIITASINHTTYTLANIYGPNCDDPVFFNDLFNLLSNSNNLIIAGDFNTVINPAVDRSSTSGNSRNWHSTEIIKQYMADYGLSDSWRMRNPGLREYSYSSSAHQCSSRIDLFIISNSLIPNISDNTIHSIVISDHAPVSLCIQTQAHIKTQTRWRFNTSLLEDPDFSTLIRREWTFYLKMNDSPDTSPSLLWEAGKAFIRGKIISYSSYKKKQQQQLEYTIPIAYKRLL